MSPRINTTNTRLRTLAIGLLVLLAVLGIAMAVPVPLVALGPGPTFNTLGEVNGKPVVSVTGRPTFATTGRINMTTVQVFDGLTALNALRFWVSGEDELVNRALIFPPGKSNDQVQQENTSQFNDSEEDAKAAALSYLNQPVKVLVGAILPAAPAAGVLKVGDRLLNVKGEDITSAAQVSRILTATRPGDQVPLTFQRGDTPPTQAVVKVGSRDDGPQGFLGIVAKGRVFDPNQIVISLADVGGPSAGLAFALAVTDKLTPDDLAGGKFIAGTGEIDSTGRVSPIGGISQKMIAARQEGATVFLTPSANCAEAAANTPDGLKLVKVTMLSDAVDSLMALKQGKPTPQCAAG